MKPVSGPCLDWFMSTTTQPPAEGLDSPVEVLGFARSAKAEADRAQANLLVAAVTWAEQHPPESIGLEATWTAGGGDTGLPLAGPGAPLVAEFAIAEFAAALGMSTDAGRSLIAGAVELKYRLPKVWTRVHTAQLPAWKARRIAESTLGLTQEAATHVDDQVAAYAHKIGYAALERLIEEAVARFMPARALQDAQQAADGRHVTFHHQQVSCTGTTYMEAELDLADALDLDTALTRGAEELKNLGSAESLDVRRALAAGQLARHQLALELDSHTVPTGSTTQVSVKPRQLVLYVHLSEAAITGPKARSGAGSGGEPAPGRHRRAGPHLVRQPRHPGHGEAGDRHGRTHPRHRLRGSRPAPRTDRAARPHLRVPLVHPVGPPDRLRPRHRLRAGRHHLQLQHRTPVSSTPSVEDTFDVDLHRASNPGRSSGRAPTATSSSATTTAPEMPPQVGHPHSRKTHPTSDHAASRPAGVKPMTSPSHRTGTGMCRTLRT